MVCSAQLNPIRLVSERDVQNSLGLCHKWHPISYIVHYFWAGPIVHYVGNRVQFWMQSIKQFVLIRSLHFSSVSWRDFWENTTDVTPRLECALIRGFSKAERVFLVFMKVPLQESLFNCFWEFIIVWLLFCEIVVWLIMGEMKVKTLIIFALWESGSSWEKY